ncbi:MFS transporter [Sphingopyxis microcysteis]|uniref:MFS transporter n=1 Tax=Sphingopyxis microcysteis TaxID=2484145 RepID=UPI001446AC92|nr:MFS transporter [Sphingopyxis microcysteis]
MASNKDERPMIAVSDVLDNAPFSAFHFGLILLCTLVAIVDGFDTTALGVIAPTVARDWGLSLPTFAPALAASLVGMALGGAIGGMLGDRFGRRPVMIIMFVIVTLATLASAFAKNIQQLEALRLLTGLGIGGTIPLGAALVAEYMPKRHRSFLLVVMFSGHALGGTLAGLLAPFLINNFGWRSVFFAGGIAPAILVFALLALLPESARYLTAQGTTAARARAIGLLTKANATARVTAGAQLTTGEQAVARGSVADLFKANRGSQTVFLWITFFATQFVLFALASWLTSLLTQAGHSQDTGAYAQMLHNLGGVFGSLAFGLLSDRLSARPVLIAVNFGSIVFIAGLGMFAASDFALLMALVSGVFVLAAQLCLNAYTTGLYPTPLRATGVGWALSFGRLGSILSPLVTGALMARDWTPSSLFFAIAAVPLISIVALTFVRGERHETSDVIAGH